MTMAIASQDFWKPTGVPKAKLGVEGLWQINGAWNYFYMTAKNRTRQFYFLSFKFGSIQHLAAEISSAKFYPGAAFQDRLRIQRKMELLLSLQPLRIMIWINFCRHGKNSRVLFFVTFQKFWALINSSGIFIIHPDAIKQRNGTAGASVKKAYGGRAVGGPINANSRGQPRLCRGLWHLP